jgi:hypothetical protein
MCANTVEVGYANVVQGLQDARLAGKRIQVILLVDILEPFDRNRPAHVRAQNSARMLT